MGGYQRLLHFDRRDVGAAANDDVFLAGYEPELISLATPHQIAGMIPTGPEAFLCCSRVAPITVEDICPADQEFTGLAVGDVTAIFVDQANPRALHDPRDWPMLQTEGQGPNDFRCAP